MGSIRVRLTPAVAGVLAWKLTALALLPAAFCCRAALDADRGAQACCQGKDHGAFCPLGRAGAPDASDGAAGDAPHDSGGPQWRTCESMDDALLGLLGLTGFTPERSTPSAVPAASGKLAPTSSAAASCDETPPCPPPRA